MFLAARRRFVRKPRIDFSQKWSDATSRIGVSYVVCDQFRHRRSYQAPSERSNQIRIAPRAVLRRREGTCFSSPSDDEVGVI